MTNSKQMVVKHKGWHNLMPVYIGYTTDGHMAAMPRVFDRAYAAMCWLWYKIFIHDLVIITADIKPYTITIEDDDDNELFI